MHILDFFQINWLALSCNFVRTHRAFIRGLVLTRDNYTCMYCLKPLTKDEDFGVDHVIRHSLVLDYVPSNLVACCQQCNTKKGCRDLSPEDLADCRLHMAFNAWRLYQRTGILTRILPDIIEPWRWILLHSSSPKTHFCSEEKLLRHREDGKYVWTCQGYYHDDCPEIMIDTEFEKAIKRFAAVVNFGAIDYLSLPWHIILQLAGA